MVTLVHGGNPVVDSPGVEYKARVRYVFCEEPGVGKVAVARVAMVCVVGVGPLKSPVELSDVEL